MRDGDVSAGMGRVRGGCRGDVPEPLHGAGVEVGGKKMNIRSKLFLNEKLNCTFRKLSSLKEYQEADIIHLHNIHGGYFDLSSLIEITNTKRIVWTLHDMWCITGGEAHTFEFDGYKTGDARSPYKSNYPLNDPWIDCRKGQINQKKYVYNRIGNKLVMVPVSHWLENMIKQSYVFDDNIILKTIHNGIDTDFFINMRQRHWEKPRILFFNSMNPFKGSHLFIESIQQIVHSCEVYVVGTGLFHDSKLVAFKNIASALDRDELRNLYNNVDILVYPSTAENLSLTLLEAMSCGVCVLASDVGGNPEIVNNSDVGILFKSGDVQGLTLELNELLSGGLSKARKIGENSSIFIHEQFSLKQMLLEYDKLYSSLN